MEIIFLSKIMSKQKRDSKYNNHKVYRDLVKIGVRYCNLCKKKFNTYSKFDRFCLVCKHTEIYRGYHI